MTDALPAAEAWVRLAGLAIGAAVVLIVPLTGFMKEYWAYRARIRESDKMRADTARHLPPASLGAFLETSDLVGAAADLAAAARDLTIALRSLQVAGADAKAPVPASRAGEPMPAAGSVARAPP